ncbi:MAG: aspartate/glutamate racemase family protein [Pseudomonadota bacterium]
MSTLRPTIGLIVPPADGAVPPEPPVLFPDIRFVARGLGLPRLTPTGYDAVIGQVAETATELKNEGAAAISLMGTSLSFYRGPSGNADVLEAMRSATGLPVTTMTDSVIEALTALKASSLAVATAYAAPVNEALRDYLVAAGFRIMALEAMDLTEIDDIQAVDESALFALGERAAKAAPGADALFISCGGLRTLPVILPLEEELGLPVVTSATAGAWGAARLVGHSGMAHGFGKLFALPLHGGAGQRATN